MAIEYDVEVEWKAFELHPGVPPEGMAVPFSKERIAAGRSHFEQLAAEAGLSVSERTHWYDSGPAHEATIWAKQFGKADDFKRAVLSAYFVDGRNIGSADVLADLATRIGLDPDKLRDALKSHQFTDLVRAEFEEARMLGITSVPTFIAGGYALVGAHPYESFHKLMEAIGGVRRLPPSDETDVRRIGGPGDLLSSGPRPIDAV